MDLRSLFTHKNEESELAEAENDGGVAGAPEVPEQPQRPPSETPPDAFPQAAPDAPQVAAQAVEVASPSFLPPTAAVETQAEPLPLDSPPAEVPAEFAPEIPPAADSPFAGASQAPLVDAAVEAPPEMPATATTATAEPLAAEAPAATATEPTATTAASEPPAPATATAPATAPESSATAPEPSAPAAADAAPQSDPAIAAMAESIARMEARLEATAKTNEWGRSSLNKLADELDVYRKNFLAEAQLPLLKRLCTYVGSIEKVATAETITQADIEFLRDQVVDILADQSIEPVDDPLGEKLNGKRHRGTRVVPTDDLDRDGTIAETLSKGWVFGERVIMPQVVHVYKYSALEVAVAEPPAETAGETAADSAVPAPSQEPQLDDAPPAQVAPTGEPTEPGEPVSSENEGGSNE